MFKIIVTILGVAMSLGYFPQTYKLYKTKDASSISVLSFSVFSIGTAIWTIYGMYIHDMVVILSFAIGVVGSWSILIQTLIYKHRARIA